MVIYLSVGAYGDLEDTITNRLDITVANDNANNIVVDISINFFILQRYEKKMTIPNLF